MIVLSVLEDIRFYVSAGCVRRRHTLFSPPLCHTNMLKLSVAGRAAILLNGLLDSIDIFGENFNVFVKLCINMF